MLVKIFGILDLLSAISLLLLKVDVGKSIGLFFGGYLILKSIPFLFTLDFASFLDFFAGIFFFVVIFFNFYPLLGLTFVIWLFQKGLFSLM